jgi:nucleotide-binding universal stress UspA family protein
MKTILVATDFSPAALNAANYAAEMALAINADLLLLHMYNIPVGYSEVPLPVSEDDIRQDAEKALDELRENLTQKTGSKLSMQTELRLGEFFQELKTVCERVKPYTVVMGSQGTTAAERMLFGSHTIHAMKLLMWPVIAVPPKSKFSSARKIGLACDFDKVVDLIPIDEIKMLVSDFDAELHILNTGKKRDFQPELVLQADILENMLKALKPKYHFITTEDRDQGILDYAEKNQIDLLVVLPKRHSLMDNLIRRSHTRQFVLHSHVPVMALHQ